MKSEKDKLSKFNKSGIIPCRLKQSMERFQYSGVYKLGSIAMDNSVGGCRLSLCDWSDAMWCVTIRGCKNCLFASIDNRVNELERDKFYDVIEDYLSLKTEINN
jgi:hypothetical protein